VIGGDAAGLLVPDALRLHAHASIAAADSGDALNARRIAAAQHRRRRQCRRFGVAGGQSAQKKSCDGKTIEKSSAHVAPREAAVKLVINGESKPLLGNYI
jgi:hypothetical protein